MIEEILQGCCVGLFVIAIEFIVIELQTKFNRSFILFGVNLILLCLFSSFDLWDKYGTYPARRLRAFNTLCSVLSRHFFAITSTFWQGGFIKNL